MEKELFHNELKRVAPQLEKLREQNPFLVPEDYFETFPEQIQSKISAKQSATHTRFAIKFGILQKLMVSSIAVVLLALAGYQFFLTDHGDSFMGSADQIWIEEHMDWYADYEADVFYDLLFSYYEPFDEDELFTDEAIVDYLLEKDYYFIEQVLFNYD